MTTLSAGYVLVWGGPLGRDLTLDLKPRAYRWERVGLIGKALVVVGKVVVVGGRVVGTYGCRSVPYITRLHSRKRAGPTAKGREIQPVS